jgi:hypothetical protein
LRTAPGTSPISCLICDRQLGSGFLHAHWPPRRNPLHTQFARGRRRPIVRSAFAISVTSRRSTNNWSWPSWGITAYRPATSTSASSSLTAVGDIPLLCPITMSTEQSSLSGIRLPLVCPGGERAITLPRREVAASRPKYESGQGSRGHHTGMGIPALAVGCFRDRNSRHTGAPRRELKRRRGRQVGRWSAGRLPTPWPATSALMASRDRGEAHRNAREGGVTGLKQTRNSTVTAGA